MKKQGLIIGIVSILIGLSSLGVALFLLVQQKKIYYVELGEVYDTFTMKTEMESQLNSIYNKKKEGIDSLRLQLEQEQRLLTNTSSQSKKQEIALKLEGFNLKERQFVDDMERLRATYTERVWTQINQYVADYGEMKEVDMIIGAAGNGNLMYGGDGMNITKDISAYINQRYAGEPKKPITE